MSQMFKTQPGYTVGKGYYTATVVVRLDQLLHETTIIRQSVLFFPLVLCEK